MITCPKCGTENPDRAKFCLECASPLVSERTQTSGTRKLVTILFADVVGSTELGEHLDPEALRGMLARYFTQARTIVQRHGGVVEKFIGDAVMAVFGIPLLHEDDALRAVRAALELRDAIARLNDELAEQRGVRFEFRIGVNSGEVVAGTSDRDATLVTGDAVNVAARLEQSAAPGEIVLGELTLRLVRDFVNAEALPPIDAKGKSRPVNAYRLLSLADARPAAATGRFVGRRREMTRLTQAFDDAREEARCYLFTLLGSAGVGKSRLVAEFTASVGDRADVLHGRCLPYGEGITFWPLTEIVRSVSGFSDSDTTAEARERIAETLGGEPGAQRVADLVSSAIGLADVSVPRDELFWAIRRWLEVQAQGRGIVCIIEDIHWAEPTLLDLIEHIADWTRDAAILLLCTGRPELLEARPTWGGGKLNATTLLLEPLSGEVTRELVEALVGTSEMPAGVVDRILETAEGNPLYAEEIVRMLAEDGAYQGGQSDEPDALSASTGDVRIPTSVHAVIAARLDRLPPHERGIAERAAVAGRVFERGAVIALVPEAEREGVPQHLLALVRKELVHPDRPELTLDEAFRFRHLLIRDTAYEGLPKQQRAELHERFAQWVEQVVGDRAAEYGEVIGYHYEQAHRYRLELGLDDEATARLARRAGEQLAAAGRRAYTRRDGPAAAKLLGRAAGLMEAGHERRNILVTIALTHLNHGQFRDALAAAMVLEAEATTAGDETSLWQGRLLEKSARTWSDPEMPMGGAEELAHEAIAFFEREADSLGLALAYAMLGDVDLGRAQWARAKEVNELGERHASGVDPVLEEHHRLQGVNAAFWGPTPLDEYFGLVDAELDRMRSELGRSRLLGIKALGQAMAGDGESARGEIAKLLQLREQLGAALSTFTSGLVEYVLGDLHAAELAYARTSAEYEEAGETGARSTIVANWAICKFDLGRPDEEVAGLVELSRQLGAPDDAITQLTWRQAAALVAARAGRREEAWRLTDEARALAEDTDALFSQGLAARDRGRVAEMLGDRGSAREAYEKALAYFDQKGDVSDAAQVRKLIARLNAGDVAQ